MRIAPRTRSRAPTGHTAAVNGTEDLRTPAGFVVAATALRWSFARAHGAGGQHVNKTATKVTVEVDLADVQGPPGALARLQADGTGTLRVTSQTSRSQWRNRQECLERLAELLDGMGRPPAAPRRPSRPTRGSVERRLAAKRRTSDKKLGRRGSASPEW